MLSKEMQINATTVTGEEESTGPKVQSPNLNLNYATIS